MTVHYSTDNKALHDLRDELKDLNKTLKETIKTNDRFTKVLLLVAILQLFIALTQFVASLFGLVAHWLALAIEIVFVIAFLFAFRSMARFLGLESGGD